MRIVLAGGGTGGHVYPALAMGDALRARGHEVVYAGDPERLEARVAPERDYRFYPVRAPAYPRRGQLAKLGFGLSLLRSTWRARSMLKEIGPDLVLGVGGYIMAPTMLAARSMGISTVLHESNVAPGLANRLCARVADLCLLTYEATRERLPGKRQLLVGCPVHPKLRDAGREEALERYGLRADQPVLVVVGGSLGAATLNAAALAAARCVPRSYQLLWICGPRYHEQAARDLGQPPPGVVLKGYEDRMADAYAAGDLVLCRAGSSTLSELTALGKASLLLPSPNVTDNHQEANARGLEAAGAARVLVERDLKIPELLDCAESLLADAEARAEMERASQALGRWDVAEEIARLLERGMSEGFESL